MKKILLSLAVILVTVFSINAQSYSLSWEGEALGDTVVLLGDPDAEIVFGALLTNNSANTDTIKIVRRLVKLIPDVSHYFCWGVCYQPNLDSIFAPNAYVVLEANQTSGEFDFSAHYEPLGVIGTSTVEYTFFNQSDENENIVVVAKFVTSPDGINDNILNNSKVSEIYPNPAENFINLDYELPNEVRQASIKIVNILGSIVKEQQIDTRSNTHRIDISDINGGIYFYSVLINGEALSTKKLIVR
ncbi:MAG: T9SS type A sorting domain-containing protein [Bacteroidetes bacterium]|nr:T9SS type A sorting domain-containing protein [Bacteroidota bacterium]